MAEDLNAQVRDHEIRRDITADMQSRTPVDYNLALLTESEEFIEFLDEHAITRNLTPLADAIMATNKLTDWKSNYYKAKVDSMVIKAKMWSNEDEMPASQRLDVAQTRLHALIERSIGGYGGELATVKRSAYETRGNEPPQKRSWWPW